VERWQQAWSRYERSDLLNVLLILSLSDGSIGKWYEKKGNRYEGEWKDNNMHGQGKKEVIFFVFY